MSTPHTIITARPFSLSTTLHSRLQLQDKYEYPADRRYVAG